MSLSINNNKTEQVPSLNQTYSSKGVISLNVDNEDGLSVTRYGPTKSKGRNA